MEIAIYVNVFMAQIATISSCVQYHMTHLIPMYIYTYLCYCNDRMMQGTVLLGSKQHSISTVWKFGTSLVAGETSLGLGYITRSLMQIMPS